MGTTQPFVFVSTQSYAVSTAPRLTTAAAVSSTILYIVSETKCYDGWSFYATDRYPSIWEQPDACWALYTTSAFAFVQVIITVAWLAMVTYKANHTPGLKPSKAYRVPTHRLLAGKVDGDSYDMSTMRRSSDVERAKKVVDEED